MVYSKSTNNTNKLYIKKGLFSFTCLTAEGLLLTLLKVEAFDGHRLALILGSVDNGPTASLANDTTLLLSVLQVGPV